MDDLTAPLTELIAALDARTVSSRELVDATFERIERLDGPINAVVTVAAECARDEADAIDDARANGRDVGRLGGVPITVKDALATSGIRSTGGAVELLDHVPDEDATVVDRVRREGAVVIGKTNLPRWSGDYQSYNEMFGTTNNPWDVSRTPGGSSGGAAAAVAMGFTAFEIGTDIGGSIRVPASFTGVFGHKPSFGTIPTYGYLDHPTLHRNVADVNVFGPLARSVDDLELLVGLLAGANPDDRVDGGGWRLELPPPRAVDIADFRVVAWLDDPFCPVDPAVTAVLEAAVDQLESAGARIDRDRRPDLDPASAAHDGALLIATATSISDSDDDHAAATAAGRAATYRSWDVANRRRGATRRRWAEFFEDVDVLLCPTTVVPPFHHVHATDGPNWARSTLAEYGNRPYSDLLGWCGLIGSTYLPVTVPPVGRTTDGLPIGVQVVAPYLHDRTALAFARCISDVVGGYTPPPAALA